MFLNPWYGQVGAGPATQDESTTMAAAAEGEATPATVEVNHDARVKEDSAVSSAAVQESAPPAIASAKQAESDNKEEGSAASSAPPPPSDQAKTFQNRLKCGWTAHMTQEGRLFYCK